MAPRNSYFSEMPDEGSDPEILKLATDKCLFVDEGFMPFALKYKDSQEAFFVDYKKASVPFCTIAAATTAVAVAAVVGAVCCCPRKTSPASPVMACAFLEGGGGRGEAFLCHAWP